MEFIELNEPIKYSIPLWRRFILPRNSKLDSYKDYLEFINKIDYKKINSIKRAILRILLFFSIIYGICFGLMTILMIGGGSWSLITFVIQILSLDLSNENYTTIFAMYLILIIVILVLFVIFLLIFSITLKLIDYSINSYRKPIWLSSEEKRLLGIIQSVKGSEKLNPEIENQRILKGILPEKVNLSNLEYKFNFLHPKFNLEDFSKSTGNNFSLFGVTIAIFINLFSFFVVLNIMLAYFGVTDLENSSTPSNQLYLVLLIFETLITYIYIIKPSKTFYRYWKIKKFIKDYYTKNILDLSNKILTDQNSIVLYLKLLSYNQLKTETEKLPMLPVKNIINFISFANTIKLGTLIGLIISSISFIASRFLVR